MASYTRQSTFSDGDLITAALFNDEYNQLLSAFENTTGHKHDGTVGEGPVIGILGDAGVVTPLNKILIDTTNDHIEFWIDVSGTSTQQLYIADGAIVPVTDNDIDLGTSSLQFKNLYINGTANIDSLVADTADINGGTIDGTIIGGTSAAAITGTTITGTSFVIGSASIDETELEILDGATLTTTELNYVDGVTSSIQTQIDTKAPLASPSLTGIPTAPTAASNTNTTQIATTAYVQTEITELIAGAPGTLDTLNELAAAINNDANYNTTLTTALATKLPLAGGTMTGDVTYSDNVKAQFGTSNDLQIFHDGNDKIVSSSSYLLLEGSNIILRNNGGTEDYAKFFGNSAVELYYDNSKKLATASTGVDVTGTITADALTVDDITINGSTISDGGSITIDTEGDFIVDSEGDVYLDAAGNDWNLNSAGTNVLKVTNTSGDISIKSMTSDKDLIFKGVDGGSTVTALTLDMSDAGKALFNAGANFGSGIDVTGTTVTDALTVESTLPTITLSETDDSTYSTIAQSFGYLQISADAGNTGTGDGIVFKVDNTELVRITSDGSVGIGTNSPTTPLHVYHATTDTVANFQSGDNSVAVNFTALDNSMQIATSNTDGILKNNGAGSLRFFNNGSEAARIDGSQNFMVGKTTAGVSTTGVELRNYGQILATRSGNYPLLLNRTTSDGDIIQLRKDGTTVGSIGAESSKLNIGNGDTGIEFNAVQNAIIPHNQTSNANVDNSIDLGFSSLRFKDLYLAGTANFGSLSDGTITITGFADEDDMSSNSATLVPTQQSVKAYVDSQVSSAGGTGISFADNEKAKFGDGLDLQIYHDGSNSYIREDGSGSLRIQGADLELSNPSEIKWLKGYNNNRVELFYNNAIKLTTTTTGIDVTGTVTADGLTVTKASGDIATLEGSGTTADVEANLVFNPVYDVNARIVSAREGASLKSILSLQTGEDNTGATKQRLKISGSGDISFYEDTGTTPSFVWTAASTALKVTGAEASRVSDTYLLDLDNSAQGSNISVAGSFRAKGYFGDSMTINGRGDVSLFNEAGAAKFFWDASAESLGIGTTSPSSFFGDNYLVIGNGTGTPTSTIYASSSGTSYLLFADGTTGSQAYAGGLEYSHASDFLGFFANGGEKMRIDSSGNVGIGTSSPVTDLDVRNNISMGDGTSVTQLSMTRNSANYIAAINASGYLVFRTGGTDERMRIDSSGNLLLGTTNTAVYTTSNQTGFVYRADFGLIGVSRQSNYSGSFNRYGTDGDILNFRKDGSTVGSIGTTAGYAYYNGSQSGIDFYGVNALPTSGGTNVAADAVTSLGNSNFRFKDLYLSGGLRGDTTFKNNAGTTEYARFDSSGNLLVGTTNDFPPNDTGNEGVAVKPDNIAISRNQSTPLFLDRMNTDGNIIDLRKDGTTVGVIGSQNWGIGTGSPTPFLANSKVLEISDDSGVGSELILTNNSAMSADEIVGSLIFKNTDASGTPNHFAGLRARAESTFGRMDLEFYAGRSRMEGGTPDMVITPSGADAQAKVGIGTTPNTNLHVYDASGGATLKIESNTANAYDSSKIQLLGGNLSTSEILLGDASSATTGRIIYRHDGNSLAFDVNGSEAARIDSSGRLFLGTSTVATANTAGDDFVIKGSGTSVGMTIAQDNPNGTGSIFFGDTISSSAGSIRYNHNTGDMAINVEDNLNISADAVGIGTTSPDTKLTLSYSANGSSEGLKLNSATRTVTEDNLSAIEVVGNANYGTVFNVQMDGQIQVSPRGSEAMRITSGGLVGIGTTSPSEELTIRASVPKIQIEDSDGTNQYGQFYHSAGITSILARNNTTDGTIVFQKYDGTTTDETMRIDSSGNLLVGKTAASSATVGFQAGQDGFIAATRASGQPLVLNRTTTDGIIADFRKDSTTVGSIATTSGAINLYGGSGTNGITVDSSGNLTATANVTAFSDERLKENIETLQGSKVLEMRGVSFTKDGEASSGVIAQEIEKVAPELVHTAKDEMGTKSVAYGNLVGYLIEAIKDQQKQIDDLKERLDNGTS